MSQGMGYEITLPWPPSVNHYWRHPNKGPLAGRHLISEEGRQYRQAVYAAILGDKSAPRSLAGEVAVCITAYRPDRRKRDLDNLCKSVLDALTYASAWEDDSQIVDLRIRWGQGVVKGGKLLVEIAELGAVAA